jgi:RecA-family ATPase
MSETSVDVKLLAARMMRVFVGNTKAHYTADFRNVTIEKGGKRVPKYREVAGPATIEEFIAHLQGKIGLLIVPVTQAGAVKWGKLDVDVYGEDPVVRAQKYAQAISRQGLPLITELSKSGGVHLATYSPHTQSATDMRAKLADWSAALNLSPKTEIFPKAEKLLDGETGSGINLPYFFGDSPECRNYAIDKNGNRLTVNEWLDLIENMPSKPTHVPGQVDVEAAIDHLAKAWTDGQRDNLSMAVGGALLRAGVETSTIQEILDGVMSVTADTGTHASAAQLETMMSVGKKVPGYPRMVELMGAEDAQELMRLCGGKPPADPVPFEIRPMPAHWATNTPPSVVYAVEPLFPKQVAAVVAAEGGTGKTGFGLAAALSVATGRPLYGLPVTQGVAVYIALEENENSLWRRLFKIIADEVHRMQSEGLSAASIEQFHADHQANLFPVPGAGVEMHLIQATKGDVGTNEQVIERLIEKMPPSPVLIVMDPIARVNGTDENANHVSTALINAGERIAQKTGAAFVYMHHVPKAAIKNRDVSMNAARGGSALIAGARSSIRLAPVTDGEQFGNVPKEVIAAGDLVECIHNKLNDGKKCDRFYLRRQGLSFERFEPRGKGGNAQQNELLNALFNWYVNNEHRPFAPKRFEDTTALRAMFPGYSIARATANTVVDLAMQQGDIVESDITAPRSKYKLLKFRDDFEAIM